MIANRSYVKPTTLTIEPHAGWQLSCIIAALEADKLASDAHHSTWRLGPGGCVMVECAK